MIARSIFGLTTMASILLLASCASPMPTPTATEALHTPTYTPTGTSSPTPTNTPPPSSTPTITPSPTTTPTATPIPIHPVGAVMTHEPNENIPYMWFSYVPGGLSKDATVYILITGLHGEMASYEKAAFTSERMLEERLRWPYIDQFALLVPVIPRRDTPHVYPVAFDLQNFYESDEFYKRADLKVNLMIEKLTSDLTKDGYEVSDKVLIEGFSAGGMFAQRYALLHPARVKAIAAGQCGGNFTLPESSYQDKPINWPVGVNNLQTLTGFEFDRDSYMRIAQFIYIGDLDTGEGGTTIVWSRDWGPQYMWESVDQLDFLKSHFGETDPVRLQNQIDYLNSIGYVNIEFRLYPGVGHELKGQMVQDFMRFLADQAD